jgi:hypothetical protein
MANSNLDENIRNLFGDTHIDHEALKEEAKKKKTEANKEIPPCPYPLPTPKKGVKKIDLPHKYLTGKLTIEDYPDLDYINVGNNELEALVIRNCPQL